MRDSVFRAKDCRRYRNLRQPDRKFSRGFRRTRSAGRSFRETVYSQHALPLYPRSIGSRQPLSIVLDGDHHGRSVMAEELRNRRNKLVRS